jgi:hypothetical protein
VDESQTPICPICFSQAEVASAGVYCPNCKLVLAANMPSFLQKNPPAKIKNLEVEQEGKTKKEKGRIKKRVVKLLIIFLSILLIIGGLFLGYLYLWGDNGYREQLFSNYGFTEEAKWYLRLNTLFLVIQDTPHLPTGNSSKYAYKTRTVISGSKNDQLAIHELSHAWYWKISGKIDSKRFEEDASLKKNFTDVFLRLSEEKDKEFENAALYAGAVRAWEEMCPKCLHDEPLDYSKIDTDHLFVFMTSSTMGKFKEGKMKLPEYMWPYLETMYTGKVRVSPCYETDTCENIRFNPQHWREVIEKSCKKVTSKFCENYK